MGKITANTRSVDEGLLRSRFGVAHAGDIVDVAVDSLQYRHDPTDAILGAGEFALRKPHELVGWAKAAWEQERQHFAWEFGPQVLLSGRRQQLPKAVFDDAGVSNGHIAGKCSPYAAVPIRCRIGKKFGRGLNIEGFRKNDLVACPRSLQICNDLSFTSESVDELGLDRQLHVDPRFRLRAISLQDLSRFADFSSNPPVN